MPDVPAISTLILTSIAFESSPGHLPDIFDTLSGTASSRSLVEPLGVWILEDWIVETEGDNRN